MPDGKPDIDEDLEDDPFEGVELGDDAPEPTQEEMDEWATLDTPDEDVSPSIGARSTSPAAAPVAPSSAAPAVEPQNAEQHKNEELMVKDKSKEEGRDRPSDTEPAPTNAAASFAAPEPQPAAPPAAAEPQAMEIVASVPSISPTETARAAGLSEITPSSPPRPQRNAKDQVHYDDEEDDHRSELQRQQQQLLRQQQQRQSGGGGWGVGWGSGWGLGALGGKLREVAAGAVRDVKDLTETFQAALADVTGAEDEVDQAGRISAMDRAAEAAEAGSAAAEDPDEAAKETSSASPTDAPRQAAEPAREGAAAAPGGHAAGAARSALAASAGGTRGSAGGAGDAGPSAPADPALEAGLQAIDAQVEQLATGAARAFSSLWGGLSSVAKVVAAEVAASVADVQSIEAVRGVAQIGTKLAHTAERGLEKVGRTAMVLLEEVAGVGGGGGLPGRRRIWGEEADARAADMGREPASFQDFFYIYGGEQLAEEVNNLSNECAHLCNKSRSKLEGDQQQALDEALARLGPYFNDPWVGAKQAAAAAAATESGKDAGDAAAAAEAPSPVPELDAGSKEAAERLGQMYDPIGYLCQDSLSRSETFLHQLLEAVAAARAAEAVTAASPAKRTRAPAGEAQEVADEGDGEEEEEGEEEREALLRAQRQQAEPRVLLESFHAHFTKRLAEVTTAQLQLMLNLGASLAAPARTGRPAVDGVAWPDSSEQQAALLAAEARRMVADLQAITNAYVATINALRAPPPPQAEEGAAEGGDSAEEPAPAAGPAVDGKVLDEMAAALTANAESAMSSIKGGYKGLLYAVLLRSLVTQIAQQEEEVEVAETETEEDGVSEGGGAGVSGATEEAVQAPSAQQQ
ncbi:hypothetical protein PLESTB_000172200 [Pleodorina starrii]|uniref:DUF7798 domain-containing protein n=1 Tax=Pleodorina starrii TaxID=330485 RepID=A0A9W6EY89_9CHLO|nr:hypothetical protein PLESTB_000172200 [Pleodorina starrii]